jgi:hypothetical protein
LRLAIYGSGLASSTNSANSLVINVTQVFNVLPAAQVSQILPLDYSVEDTTVQLGNIGKDLAQMGANSFSSDDEEKLIDYIMSDSKRRKELLKCYKDMTDVGMKYSDLDIPVGPTKIRKANESGYEYKMGEIVDTGLAQKSNNITRLSKQHIEYHGLPLANHEFSIFQ